MKWYLGKGLALTSMGWSTLTRTTNSYHIWTQENGNANPIPTIYWQEHTIRPNPKNWLWILTPSSFSCYFTTNKTMFNYLLTVDLRSKLGSTSFYRLRQCKLCFASCWQMIVGALYKQLILHLPSSSQPDVAEEGTSFKQEPPANSHYRSTELTYYHSTNPPHAHMPFHIIQMKLPKCSSCPHRSSAISYWATFFTHPSAFPAPKPFFFAAWDPVSKFHTLTWQLSS